MTRRVRTSTSNSSLDECGDELTLMLIESEVVDVHDGDELIPLRTGGCESAPINDWVKCSDRIVSEKVVLDKEKHPAGVRFIVRR